MISIRVVKGLVTVILAFQHVTAAPSYSSSPQNVSTGLQVPTTSGNIQGFINETTPNVRQFLSIPFAQPPTGDLRWMPPVTLPSNQSSTSIDATAFGLSCAQYESAIPSVYNTYVREFFIHGPNGEDCLSLSIWGPLNTHSDEKLPVVIFLYGGGLQTGGSSVPYQDPAKWVERTQAHIVVSIQYRLNIFGFPNAPGLEAQNLGFMDQRVGVEWLRDNIAAFGGNPDQMVLWGQSAGAGSTDVYNYAYVEDPIVQGFICDSGNALSETASNDITHSNFTFVAAHFNCTWSQSPASATDLLACMRAVPAADIESFLKSYQDSKVAPTIAFSSVIDNTLVFSNYTSRLLNHQLSGKPVIYGSNDIDTISLDPFPTDPLIEGANRTLAEINFLADFTCPIAAISRYRTEIGLTTYRFQYRGNFSNIAPLPWLGAYHSSELPMIFGTSADFRGNDTWLERETSRAMQDAWLAFVREPEGGLERTTGWGNSSEGFGEVFGGRSTDDVTGRDVPRQFISLEEGMAESCAVK